MVLTAQQQLLKDNPEAFKDVFKGAIPTSVDLLSEDSKLLKVMYDAQTAPGVKSHSIIGEGIKMAGGETGDGIVPASSATLPNVASELRIQAPHELVHRHPRATLEVKRILHEHWKECMSDGSLRKVTPAAATAPMVLDAPTVRAN
jgi:hypothetical protein